MQFIENRGDWSVFQIIDYTSTNIKHANAVASAVQLNKDNDIIDLSAMCEHTMLKKFAREIAALRIACTKFIFVYDVSNFPFIACRINTDDHSVSYDPNDNFSNSISVAWNTCTLDNVVVIVVNLHVPHTGLKLVHWD